MSPEEKARLEIDKQLNNAGYVVQDLKDLDLTAAKGVGLIYLNKGIMYGATAIGSCFGPVGTVVGFVVGGVVCIVVDIFVSNWLDDLIDKIAK